jgi:hypothetical protein
MADNIDPNMFLEPAPTEGQKALWDRFVAEYVKDFNPMAAALRVGFNSLFAQEYLKTLMAQPYVQRKIDAYKSQPIEDDKDRVATLRKRVEATFMQAMECGDPKVMVAAASKLGEMHGFMEAPDKSGEDLKDLVNAFKEVAKVVPD